MMRNIDIHERRAAILALIHKKPMATSNIAKILGVQVNAVIHDINIMHDRGWVIEDGKDEVIYSYGAKRYTAWRAVVLLTENDLERDAYGEDGIIPVPDFPDKVLLWMGYNNKRQQKGRFVDNADFHPTTTRTAPVKVYPGTSWSLMETAL